MEASRVDGVAPTDDRDVTKVSDIDENRDAANSSQRTIDHTDTTPGATKIANGTYEEPCVICGRVTEDSVAQSSPGSPTLPLSKKKKKKKKKEEEAKTNQSTHDCIDLDDESSLSKLFDTLGPCIHRAPALSLIYKNSSSQILDIVRKCIALEKDRSKQAIQQQRKSFQSQFAKQKEQYENQNASLDARHQLDSRPPGHSGIHKPIHTPAARAQKPNVEVAVARNSGRTASKKTWAAPPMTSESHQAEAIMIYINKVLGTDGLTDKAASLRAADMRPLRNLTSDEQDKLLAFLKITSYHIFRLVGNRFLPSLCTDPVKNKGMAMSHQFVWMVVPWFDAGGLGLNDINLSVTLYGNHLMKLRPGFISEIHESLGVKHDGFTFGGDGPTQGHVKEDMHAMFVPLQSVSHYPHGGPWPLDSLVVKGADVKKGACLKIVGEQFSWSTPMMPGDGSLIPFSSVVFHAMVERIQQASTEPRHRQMIERTGVNANFIESVTQQLVEYEKIAGDGSFFWKWIPQTKYLWSKADSLLRTIGVDGTSLSHRVFGPLRDLVQTRPTTLHYDGLDSEGESLRSSATPPMQKPGVGSYEDVGLKTRPLDSLKGGTCPPMSAHERPSANLHDTGANMMEGDSDVSLQASALQPFDSQISSHMPANSVLPAQRSVFAQLNISDKTGAYDLRSNKDPNRQASDVQPNQYDADRAVSKMGRMGLQSIAGPKAHQHGSTVLDTGGLHGNSGEGMKVKRKRDHNPDEDDAMSDAYGRKRPRHEL